MEPHIPTMLLMIVGVSLTLTLALAAGVSRNSRDGLFLWAIGLALHTFAYTLFELRGTTSDIAVVALANTLLSSAFALFAEGLFQFQQRKAPRRLIWLPVLVISICCAVLMSHFSAWLIVSSVIYTAQILLMLAILNQGRRSTVGRGQYYVAIGLAIAIPAFLLRVLVTAAGEVEIESMLASNQAQAATYLSTIVSITLAGIGLLLMTKERAEEQNRLLAIQDQLTGLANRRRLDEVLGKEWARANRSGRLLALILLDVDLFKKFNDCYGHQRGDECLKCVARVLTEGARRPADLAARYGGEEFLLILPEIDATGARRLTETLRQSVDLLGIPHEQSPFGKVTLSAGVAVMSNSSYKDAQSLLHAADLALYQAKQNGRNQVQLAPEPLSQANPGTEPGVVV